MIISRSVARCQKHLLASRTTTCTPSAVRSEVLPPRGSNAPFIRCSSSHQTLPPKPSAARSDTTRRPTTPGRSKRVLLDPKLPASAGRLMRASVGPNHLALDFESVDQPIPLSTLWLRDSCQCGTCVSPSSGQKRFATTHVPLAPEIRDASVKEDGSLTVRWDRDFMDGGIHESTYSGDFLSRHMKGVPVHRRSEKRLWNRQLFAEDLKPIAYKDWMHSDEHFWRGMADLHQTGLVFLEGVPNSESAVVDISKRIGHLQSTFYGETWDVVSKPQAENVAYTNEFLGLHQDLMYYADPPKIQVLHCLQNECDGGEALFSDGARAAVELRDSYPAHYTALQRFKVPYVYDRNGHFYYRMRPVIGSGGDKFRFETAWSPPFQAPFRVPRMPLSAADEPVASTFFYTWSKAASKFDSIINDPENVFEHRYRPGDCVLFDNKRIMHGRKQFNAASGRRWLKGTYVSSQEFVSRLRHMPA